MAKLIITEREAFIFEQRIRHPERRMTLEAIGDIYGVTRERIRQIEAKLLEKIARFIEKNKLI